MSEHVLSSGKGGIIVGKHILAEFSGCNTRLLNDEKALNRHMIAAAEAADLTVLGVRSHKFDPCGVSVIVLLSESHLTIHTWPELGYCAIDIFTCGKKEPLTSVLHLKKVLAPKRSVIKKLRRKVA
jgi:S-adenosylmethionine decarboxylase